MNEGLMRWKPQPSTVIASVALFVALVGTSYATVAANQVKSKHVKDNSLKAKDLKDGKAVGSAEVIDDSLTGADINESSLALAAGGATGPAGGDLTGTYPNPLIGNAKVTTAKIADGAVNSAKVADNSLTADDLGPNSVDASEIATDAVGALELAPDSVSSDELDAITPTQVNGSVANNSSAVLDASCPAGQQMISGGGGFNLFSPPAGTSQTTSFALDANTWRIIVRNDSGAARNIFAQANCLAA